jgi:hypothetical protein
VRWASFLLALLGMALLPAVAHGQGRGAQAVGAAAAVQQQQSIAAQTAYWLELYALQNGGPATPEMQAELSRRASEYFTNGAQATGVPVAGPAASYFSNGAAMTTAPTSVIPDYTFAPPAIAYPVIPAGLADAGAMSPAESGAPSSLPVTAPEAGLVAPDTSSATPPTAGPRPSNEPPESAPASPTPTELDIASSQPSAPATLPPAGAPPASTAFVPPAAAMVTVQAPAPQRATRTSSVLWAMFGGLGVGTVLVLVGVGVGLRPKRPGPR